MAWIYLLLAGVCEVAWATGMKFTGGFSSRPWLSLGTFLISFVSFVLLALSMRSESIPMGTTYAVWTGIGAVGTAIVGVLLFSEPTSLGRILCIALVVIGIVGLKIMSP
jgi:quaternary ammonium compound-resistance protein SugE